ncbi:MAG TPA: RluA family pseudouridine synthase [Clostridiaceae bacterium]|nr:RluA family pseudouridine synthase [Clostridiaceae bacterium]
MDTFNFMADDDGQRIDVWLAKHMEDHSRSHIQKLIQTGQVMVNGIIVKSNYKVRKGDNINISVPEAQILNVEPENIEIDILYEDDDIIVVNKPKNMVVHPAAGNFSGTLVNALLSHCKDSLSDINGIIRPGIVHRIDKDTTGVLVVAKNNRAHEVLSQKLKNHDIVRVYEAIADGVIKEDEATIDAPIGRHPTDRKKMAVNVKNSREATTHFKVLERFPKHTYIECRLETGRTHQIRVHMAYIGHPLLGDKVYGKKKQPFDLEGQVLHAKVLGFEHPISGKYMEFTAELPEYFKDILRDFRGR